MPSIPPSTAEAETETTVTDTGTMAAEYSDLTISDGVVDMSTITLGNVQDLGTQDILDETTITTTGDLKILVGDKVSTLLSDRTPGMISTEQMGGGIRQAVPYESATDLSDLPPWYSQIASDVGLGFAGCALIKYPMNSTFHDPDLDIIIPVNNISLYGHINYPDTGAPLVDPIINDGPLEDGTFSRVSEYGDYSSGFYENPWRYDERESDALLNKFGFDGVTTDNAEPETVTRSYVEKSINSLLERLAIGFTERKNIRKISQRVDYNAGYENITEVEPVESLNIVQRIVKQIDPMVPAPPAPPATVMADMHFEKVISDSVTSVSDISVPPVTPVPTGLGIVIPGAAPDISLVFGSDGATESTTPVLAPGPGMGGLLGGTDPETGDSIVIEGYSGPTGLDLLGGGSGFAPTTVPFGGADDSAGAYTGTGLGTGGGGGGSY